MKPYQKSRITIGVILLLAGVWLLAMMAFPELREIIHIQATWPLIIAAAGALFFIFGLIFATPNLMIPACILGGIGALLYWQNLTGNWQSWAYAWTLIPGFSGIGEVLAGLLGSQEHRHISKGLWQVFVSLVLFLIFGSFLGNITWLGSFWPLLLVVAGVFMVIRGILRNR